MIYEIGGHTIDVFDDIETLPITRFHKYNKMLLVEAGIGGDVAAADSHLAKLAAHVRKGATKDALQEIDNLRQCLYFAQQEVNPKMLAFAALVKSVDGAERVDLTDKGLQDTAALLQDIPAAEFAAAFGGIKKKIDDALRLYFPASFDEAEVKEYYDRLRAHAMRQLAAVQAGGVDDAAQEELQKLQDAVLTYFNPQAYDGAEGVEVRHDKGFETLCIALAQNMNVNAKLYSVLEFYNALEYAKDEAKKQRKLSKKK